MSTSMICCIPDVSWRILVIENLMDAPSMCDASDSSPVWEWLMQQALRGYIGRYSR
jgi:hypothetical protein